MPIDGVNDVFRVVDLTGVFANAILGGVIARRESWTRSVSSSSRCCPGSVAA